MAATGTGFTDIKDTLFELWHSQDDVETRLKWKVLIEEGLDKIGEYRKNSLGERIKKGTPLKVGTKQWLEEPQYSLRVTATSDGAGTLTFSGYIWGQSLTDGTDRAEQILRNHIQKEMVLERESDGVQVLIGDCTYGSLTAAYTAHGNTGTLTADSAATTYRRVGQLSYDADTTHVPGLISPYFRYVGKQKFKLYIKLGETEQHSAYAHTKDILMHQFNARLEDMYDQLNMTKLHISPVYSGGEFKYSGQVEQSAMTGLCQWPRILYSEYADDDIYVDMDGNAITMSKLDDLVYAGMVNRMIDYNKGDWVAAMHPITHRYLSDEMREERRLTREENTIGFSVNKWHSKIGKDFELVSDLYLRPDQLMIVNMDSPEYGDFDGLGYQVETMPVTYADYTEKKIKFTKWGVMLRNAFQSVLEVHNLPTSYNS